MTKDLGQARPDMLLREAENIESDCIELRKTFRHLPPDQVTELLARATELESSINRRIGGGVNDPGGHLDTARGTLMRARFQLSPPFYFYGCKVGAIVALVVIAALTLLCYTKLLPTAYDWSHSPGMNGVIVFISVVGTPLWLFGPIFLGGWLIKRITESLWECGTLWCPSR